ncbi:MAG: transporter [Betaproteobacteria bacterium]|nr:transporter [Betaproteobacteria bacterium]
MFFAVDEEVLILPSPAPSGRFLLQMREGNGIYQRFLNLSVRLRLAAFLSLGSLAFGANALQPLISDDTGTQGAGGYQIEFAVSQSQERFDGETTRLLSAPLVFTRGMTDTLDVYVGAAYARIHPNKDGNNSGISNPLVGAKWRFYENVESKTSLALKPEIIFPMSAGREEAGLGVGKTSGSVMMLLTQEFGFGAVLVNAAVGRDRFRHADDETYGRFSVAPIWNLTEKWQLALDMGVESRRSDGVTTYLRYAELALLYSLNKDIDLALGFLVSADNQNPRATTMVPIGSVSWRF